MSELADVDVVGAGGAYVYDFTDDEPVFASDADVPRTLASNTKLFTAAAVLDHLGADATLTTSMVGSQPIADGVIDGDLYLVGGGDPTFGTATVIENRYDGTGARVEELVDEAVAAGLTRITGDVLGDGSRFDARTNPTGGLAGLTFDRGVHSNPPLWAAQQLVRELQRHGVVVEGRAGTGIAPEDATEISEVESPPLSRLVQLMNKPSDNFFAEMLAKDLSAAGGGQGTTADATAKIEAYALRQGVDVTLSDGSGLSRQNMATPEAVVTLLDKVRSQEFSSALVASLPIAGVDGTLETRMIGTAAQGVCQAKSGTLNFGVSTLAGYCQAHGGHQIGFSILMNDLHNAITPARDAQDRMTAAIATYSAAVDVWTRDGLGAPNIKIVDPTPEHRATSTPGEPGEVFFTANRNWPYRLEIRRAGTTGEWSATVGSGEAHIGVNTLQVRLPGDAEPGRYDVRLSLFTPDSKPHHRAAAEDIVEDSVEVLAAD